MKLSKSCVLVSIAFVLASDGPSSYSQAIVAKRVIFGVWPGQKGKKPAAPILDPIVIIDGSNFRNPMSYLKDDTPKAQAEVDAFTKTYLRQGQKYSMFFGGSDKGPVVVDKAMSISCETLTATLVAPVPLVNGQKALAATSKEGIGLHANWRQPPAATQQSAFLALAVDFLARHGLAVSSSSIELRNLRSTKLAEGRPDALIGCVTVKEKSALHNLFLVVEQKGEQWDVAISSYHVSKDLEYRTDDVEENFVDQLDLDADGVDEIVTISGYYESWDYAIYKEQNGAWKRVYQGGGGGC
jgi:hypothetical protein